MSESTLINLACKYFMVRLPMIGLLMDMYTIISHRGINADYGINVDQHSKPRNKCTILYLHLFRGFECNDVH
jgi:hypothetical protein